MPHVASVVPDETDLLCEGCGYRLNGLPPSGNCPECGKPMHQSVGEHRGPPMWEQCDSRLPLPLRFLQTSFAVLLRPTHFYHTLNTRGPARPARIFAAIHWTITGVLLGTTAIFHLRNTAPGIAAVRWHEIMWLLFIVAAGGFAEILTRFAARLTAWEAAYRGIRLPRGVVLRGMHYHAPHYVPVALLALATVAGYRFMDSKAVLGPRAIEIYLYVLSGEVVVCAVYLFCTYWIAMRNMMYANR